MSALPRCLLTLISLFPLISPRVAIQTVEIDTSGSVQPNSSSQFARIALLFALLDEAQPIIDAFQLSLSTDLNSLMSPMQVFHNADHSIYVVCNGLDRHYNVHRIGTQAAAINAFLTVRFIKPDLILSVGISGAIVNKLHEKPIQIGDVFLAKKIMYHDRRVDVQPWSDGWHIGMYDTVDLHGLYDLTALQRSMQFFRSENVIVSTGNSFPECAHDHQQWQINNATLAEMEAAAIAEVATQQNVPFAAIKGVSNFVHPQHDEDTDGVTQFEQHLKNSIKNLAAVTVAVIKEILKI